MFRRRRARPDTGPRELIDALADLDHLISEKPELSAAGRTLAELLRAAYRAPISPLPPLTDDQIAAICAAWAEGKHAFSLLSPQLDESFLECAQDVCGVLRRQNPAAAVLSNWIGQDRTRFLAWAAAAVTGGNEPIDSAILSCGLDAELCHAVIRLLMLPQLSTWATTLGSLLSDGVWTRSHCPLCAAARPLLAESRGLEGRRFLRCGVCAAAWPIARLGCCFCGESDARQIDNLLVQGQTDRYRVVRCRSCDESLKVVSTLAAISAPGLLVTELATIHLDFIKDQSIIL